MADIKRDIPEEFQKIMKDFISDITLTFPEYKMLIGRWWKINEESGEVEKSSVEYIFKYCLSLYPERFFDILYKNEEIFSESSTMNTEFLPGISFKYLWTCDISQNTRDTVWKYLQLIIVTIVGSVDKKEAFGDTSKLFESINENDFKNKLQETMEEMQKMFQKDGTTDGEGVNMNNIPSADDIHNHIHGMLDGKLGNLAREIAEETARDLDIDMENVGDAKDLFENLFKNPGKLMGLVKNVGQKLDSRLKSGEINQTELMTEASEIMNKMKNTPGMGNIQEMLQKMGMQMPNMAGLGKNAKVDVNAMEGKLKQMMKRTEMAERISKKAEAKKQAQAQASTEAALNSTKAPAYSDEQLIALFSNMEKPEKTPRQAVKNDDKKKKKKK
jgi:hypothetical protein